MASACASRRASCETFARSSAPVIGIEPGHSSGGGTEAEPRSNASKD